MNLRRMIHWTSFITGLAVCTVSLFAIQDSHGADPDKRVLLLRKGNGQAAPRVKKPALKIRRLGPAIQAVVRQARNPKLLAQRRQHLLDAIRHLEAAGEKETAGLLRQKLGRTRPRRANYGSLVRIEVDCGLMPDEIEVKATVAYPTDERLIGMWMTVYEDTSAPYPPKHPAEAEPVDVSGGGTTFTHLMFHESDGSNDKIVVWVEFAYEVPGSKPFNCPQTNPIPDPDPMP